MHVPTGHSGQLCALHARAPTGHGAPTGVGFDPIAAVAAVMERVSAKKYLPGTLPLVAVVGWYFPVGSAGAPTSPVHWPGFKVNPLGVMPGERAAGSSANVMPVSWTLPVLQTWPLKGTCTTHPLAEQDNPGPGATQCLSTLSVALTLKLHVAVAVLSEFTVVEPKVLLAVAEFTTLSGLGTLELVAIKVSVHVAVSPGDPFGARVVELRIGEPVVPSGKVSLTTTLERVPTPVLWTVPVKVYWICVPLLMVLGA